MLFGAHKGSHQLTLVQDEIWFLYLWERVLGGNVRRGGERHPMKLTWDNNKGSIKGGWARQDPEGVGDGAAPHPAHTHTHTHRVPPPRLPGEVCQLRPPINILLEEENRTELSRDVRSAILTCNLQKLKGRERWKGGQLGGAREAKPGLGGGEKKRRRRRGRWREVGREGGQTQANGPKVS